MPVGNDVLSRSVVFEANGGLIENLTKKTEKIYEKGSTIKAFPIVVRSRYILDGWYDKADGGNKVTETTVIGNEQNQTLYAHWKKVNLKAGKIKSIKKKTATSISVLLEQQSDAEGYEVMYSEDKSFSCAQKWAIQSTSQKISGLSKGKTYYVKARAYKTDSTGKKVYGKYGSIKQVKLK